jgi:hypothetical protein
VIVGLSSSLLVRGIEMWYGKEGRDGFVVDCGVVVAMSIFWFDAILVWHVTW